ncbi:MULTISPECIES: FecR domain-containing protein [unclassified Sphingomonas]|jgi:transmembrane sensor|uniref:FecR family protein n=1 Tax=unclassified Sphingomonas TaxID=196159 RepID=UPI0025E3A59F|nr:MULTISPECIES: FecR domain-containing protein [unclassified Sphingomonas]
MAVEREDEAHAAAIAWHLRLPTATAVEWQAFTDWLEADDDNTRAYDALTLADAELDAAIVPPDWTPVAPAPAPQPSRWRSRWAYTGAGGLIAAGIATAVVIPQLTTPAAGRIVETRAGERRALTLADGSRVEMNGGTRLAIADADERSVVLERGEAVFDVVHDEARPFVVRSGEMRMQDVGTVFDVARVGPHLSVQVAEGAVLFQPQEARIMLTAGAALSHVDGGSARMAGVAIEDVGGWRRQRLVFRETPVRLVAAALERSTGVAVTVMPALQDVPFTGSIRIAGPAERMMPRVAALIGARAVRHGGRWTLAQRETRVP